MGEVVFDTSYFDSLQRRDLWALLAEKKSATLPGTMTGHVLEEVDHQMEYQRKKGLVDRYGVPIYWTGYREFVGGGVEYQFDGDLEDEVWDVWDETKYKETPIRKAESKILEAVLNQLGLGKTVYVLTVDRRLSDALGVLRRKGEDVHVFEDRLDYGISKADMGISFAVFGKVFQDMAGFEQSEAKRYCIDLERDMYLDSDWVVDMAYQARQLESLFTSLPSGHGSYSVPLYVRTHHERDDFLFAKRKASNRKPAPMAVFSKDDFSLHFYYHNPTIYNLEWARVDLPFLHRTSYHAADFIHRVRGIPREENY